MSGFEKSVCICTKRMYGYGGTEHQVANLALELHRRGIHVVVCSMLPLSSPAPYVRTLQEQGIPVVALPFDDFDVGPSVVKGLTPIVFILRVLAYLLRKARLTQAAERVRQWQGIRWSLGRRLGNRRRWQQVMAHFNGERGVLWHVYRGGCEDVVQRAGRSGIPVVYTDGGTPSPDMVYSDEFRAALNLMSNVIVSSQAAAQGVRGYLNYEGPVHVIPWIVPPVFAQPVYSQRQGSDLTIGCVSRLEFAKGIADLIQAVELVRQRGGAVRLLMAGSGPDEECFHSLAGQLGLEESMTFLGTLDGVGMAEFWQRIDLFVLASHAEGQPVAIWEAMSCGLPVVATRVGGVPEMVVDGLTGVLVDPGNPEQLAAAFIALASDAQLRAAMGKEGYRRYKAVADPDTVVAQILSVYATVTKGANPD